MEIPITISFKGDKTDLDKELFGLGDIVTDPKILKYILTSNEPYRYVNETGTIADGITIYRPKTKSKITESLETGLVDYHYIISIIDTALGLGMNMYTITDWFLSKLQKHDYRILINDQEIKTRDEFQQTLDEYIKNNSK